MEIKGIAVKSTVTFVKQKFASKYNEWINSLPNESFSILTNYISNNKWYSFKNAQIIPTNSIVEKFYSNKIDGAKEIGRFSAKCSLHGIYKYLVKLGSPEYIINKSANAFQLYFKDSKINVITSTKTTVTLKIAEFNELDKYTEARICGWMEKALEISGCINVKTNIINSIGNGDKYSEIFITWK